MFAKASIRIILAVLHEVPEYVDWISDLDAILDVSAPGCDARGVSDGGVELSSERVWGFVWHIFWEGDKSPQFLKDACAYFPFALWDFLIDDGGEEACDVPGAPAWDLGECGNVIACSVEVVAYEELPCVILDVGVCLESSVVPCEAREGLKDGIELVSHE